jgi:hypothetical protein
MTITLSDDSIDQALDACEHIEDAIASPTEEEPSTGSSGVPIPPPFAGPAERCAPIIDDIEYIARVVLRRAAAWRGAAC